MIVVPPSVSGGKKRLLLRLLDCEDQGTAALITLVFTKNSITSQKIQIRFPAAVYARGI